MFYTDPIQRKLDKLDDRMMQYHHEEQEYKLGIGIGMLYEKQMQRWYNEGCKGPEPQLLRQHTTGYYIARHLMKQWKKLIKERKNQCN